MTKLSKEKRKQGLTRVGGGLGFICIKSDYADCLYMVRVAFIHPASASGFEIGGFPCSRQSAVTFTSQ
ncbi:hypothetical protein T08_11347 [Trichinella sp. T8]|nr:hypothetical protein T08_11347 [Trichinella sp. T8]